MNQPEIELKDLQAAWRRVEGQVHEQGKRSAVHRVRSQARRLYVEPVLNLILAVVVMLVVGNFAADHWGHIQRRPWGACATVFVYLLAIATIHQCVRQLIALRELDGAQDLATVARISHRLERMRLRHVIATLAVGLPTWIVYPILAGQMLFGYDFDRAIPASFLVANVLFGALMAVAFLRFQKHRPWAQALRALITGQAFAKLKAELLEVEEFFEEPAR